VNVFEIFKFCVLKFQGSFISGNVPVFPYYG